MQIHFQRPDAWQTLNKALLESFDSNLQSQLCDAEVRVYPSVAFALQEAFWGLKNLFAFKKQAVLLKGQDPFIEEAGKNLASFGIAITAKPLVLLEALKPNELEQSFPELFQRETCFFAYAKNDPLLGKQWPVQVLEAELRNCNSPSVSVDYFGGPAAAPELAANRIHIFGLPNGFAGMLLGKKVQFRPIFSSNLPWERMGFELPENWSDWCGNPTDFSEFLSKVSPHFLPLFSDQQATCGDRIAIHSEKVDGAALVELLEKQMPELGNGKRSFTAMISTPSLSKWGGLKTMDWISGWGHELKKIRGTIVVDRNVISDKFIETLLTVYFHLLELQNGHQRSNKDSSFND